MFVFLTGIQSFGQTQNGFQIAWDGSVACQSLLVDPSNPRKNVSLEDIPETLCFKVCENTQINYMLSNNAVSFTTTWEVSGGSVLSSNDGSLWTWGNNIYGVSGNGTFNDSAFPSQVVVTGCALPTQSFDYLKAGYEHGKGIKIFGYSRGGNAAIRITNKLGAMGINVFQLTTFDPHSMAGGFQLLYNNVANLYNFYQNNPSDFWTKGILKAQNPFLGSPIKTNFSPAGYQVNYTGEYYKPGVLVNHLNIIRHAW